jgi:hypothetical protein
MRKINPHDFHFFDRAANVSNRRIVATLIHKQLFCTEARRFSQGVIVGILNDFITEGLNFQTQPA